MKEEVAMYSHHKQYSGIVFQHVPCSCYMCRQIYPGLGCGVHKALPWMRISLFLMTKTHNASPSPWSGKHHDHPLNHS